MSEITETTERDLITEVEELLAKRNKINRYVKSVCCNYAPCENCDQDWCGCECHDPTEEDLLELLRRLVEEMKRDRDALKAMVELWDAHHADDPCACTGADYSVGQHPVTCELCVARELMEGRNPNAE